MALFFRRFVRGAALASILGVIVCPQVACMIPQTVDAITESPHPPPHIVQESIQPYLLSRLLTLYQQGSSDTPPCHCKLVFDGLTVEEQDSTITLEARWFVDYDPSGSTGIVYSYRIDPNFNDVTDTIRPLLPYNFDPTLFPGITSGTHIVEVVVGETTGFDPASTTLPNRAMKQGYTSSTYKFVVDLHLEQKAGKCDDPGLSPSPPALRVCQ